MAASPCRTPPRLFSSSRRSSLSSASLIACRSAVLNSQELLFAVFDFVEYTQLFALARVCQRWHARLGGGGDPAAARIPSSYSMDFEAPGALEALVEGKRKALSRGHGKRRSLMSRLVARLACSEPTSPTDNGGDSRARPVDDSALPARRIGDAAPSGAAPAVRSVRALRDSSKHFDYFLRRSSAELCSLPTSTEHRAALLKRLRHVRHLRFSRRAERRLDGEWVVALIETLSHAPAQLLTLSLCGCRDAAEFSVCSADGPLLTPSFLSAHAISHAKKKPVAISDASFALLFGPTTCAAAFGALRELSLANCHHLGDASLRLLQSFPALQRLSLAHCIQLSDDTVESVVRHNSALQALDLSGCRSLTNATPYYLSSFLSGSLTELNLSGLGLINDAGVQHLSTLTRLRQLLLRALEFITDKGVLGLVACEAVTSLDLSDCPFVSNKALTALSLYLTLTTLQLSGCALLNDRGVHYIASSRHERRRNSREKQRQHKADEQHQRERTVTVDSGTASGGWEDSAQLSEREERALGLIPAAELLDVEGLDDDVEDDSSWLVPSRASSRTASPAHTPQLTPQQRALSRVPPLFGHLGLVPASVASPVPSSTPGASPLRYLSLSRCINLTDQAVRQLSAYAPLLESLDLSGCTGLTDASVMLLATSMSALRTLSLSSCPRLTNVALLSLSSMRLRCLQLSSLTALTEDGLMALCRSPNPQLSAHLRALQLNDLPRITDEALHALCTTFTGLQSLSVSHCPLLTDATAYHLSVFLPQLRQLACAGCEGLSDDGLVRLLRMPAMEHVDVSHCRRITSAALSRLIRPPLSLIEKAKEERAALRRDKQRRREKDDMVRRGELSADDFDDADDDSHGGAGDAGSKGAAGTGAGGGSASLSPSLQLLVIRGCSRISEQLVEQCRKVHKRLKIVH